MQGYRAVEVLREHAREAPARDPLSLVQYLDIKTWLPGRMLTKVDRASMAHALEVRVPLLDHQLLEWVALLPPRLKVRGHEGKYVLKKALEPYLPPEVLYRPKMGFSIPLASWLRGPLKQRLRDAVLGEALADSALFNRDLIQRMVDEHQSGLRDHGASLWALMMFAAFWSLPDRAG